MPYLSLNSVNIFLNNIFLNDMYSMTYSQLHAILHRHSPFILCNFLCKKILSILPGRFCRRINRNLWKQPTISASHCCFWIFATGNHSADSENITFNTVKTTSPALVLFITLCATLKRGKKKSFSVKPNYFNTATRFS